MPEYFRSSGTVHYRRGKVARVCRLCRTVALSPYSQRCQHCGRTMVPTVVYNQKEPIKYAES